MMENQNQNQNLPVQSTGRSFNPMDLYFDTEKFATCQRVCKFYAMSDLVPDSYKYKPEIVYYNQDGTPKDPSVVDRNNAALTKAMANCMIALNKAAIMNCDPLTIMQNMVVIYGKPSWSSSFLIATINTSGRFKPLKFRIENKGKIGKLKYSIFESKWEDDGHGNRHKTTKKVEKIFDGTEIDNLECVAYTSERGNDEILEGAPISVELAIKEGWYAKEGSKWQTMTRQMLMYRSAAFFVRTYAPEISQGMYTIEENRDIHDVEDVSFVEVKQDVVNKVESEIQQMANKKELAVGDSAPEEAPSQAPVADKSQVEGKQVEDTKNASSKQRKMPF